MVSLVIGGAASGKSAFAENLLLQAEGVRYYIATLRPFDLECRQRIEKHRAMRARKAFVTIERYTDLAGLVLPERGNVLLECMTNLAANEMYDPAGAGEKALAAILQGVERLRAQCGTLVIVSGDVFSAGAEYQGDTLAYLHLLAAVNRRLAAQADAVYELVCGLPVCHKGG